MATNTKKKVRIESIRSETKTGTPPKGATIIEKTVNTSIEQIENGYLTTKTYSGRYTTDKNADGYGTYFDYSKKWYSKEDPLLITVNDKDLADAFEDDDN